MVSPESAGFFVVRLGPGIVAPAAAVVRILADLHDLRGTESVQGVRGVSHCPADRYVLVRSRAGEGDRRVIRVVDVDTRKIRVDPASEIDLAPLRDRRGTCGRPSVEGEFVPAHAGSRRIHVVNRPHRPVAECHRPESRLEEDRAAGRSPLRWRGGILVIRYGERVGLARVGGEWVRDRVEYDLRVVRILGRL